MLRLLQHLHRGTDLRVAAGYWTRPCPYGAGLLQALPQLCGERPNCCGCNTILSSSEHVAPTLLTWKTDHESKGSHSTLLAGQTCCCHSLRTLFKEAKGTGDTMDIADYANMGGNVRRWRRTTREKFRLAGRGELMVRAVMRRHAWNHPLCSTTSQTVWNPGVRLHAHPRIAHALSKLLSRGRG